MQSVPIYVISLPYATKRREFIAKQMTGLKLDYQLIDAVDGKHYIAKPCEFPFLRRATKVTHDVGKILIRHSKRTDQIIMWEESRQTGVHSIDICYVACGRYSAFWGMPSNCLNDATNLILKEAGGTIHDSKTHDDILVSNSQLVDTLKKDWIV